jgi:hypothetical protein
MNELIKAAEEWARLRVETAERECDEAYYNWGG